MLEPAYDDTGRNSNGLRKSAYLGTCSKVGQLPLVCRGNQKILGKRISFTLVIGCATEAVLNEHLPFPVKKNVPRLVKEGKPELIVSLVLKT